MPTWAPTDPNMQRAWTAAMATLRAHEAEHETKGDEWKDEMLSRLRAMSVTVASQAAGRTHLAKEWTAWLGEHQADQRSIDPFSVLLDCAPPGSDESAAAEEEQEAELDEMRAEMEGSGPGPVTEAGGEAPT
jgi:hypothetical protein